MADPGELDFDERRTYVRSVHRYLTVHEAFVLFEKCDAMDSLWYQLEESQRPIGVFRAQPVPLLTCSRSAAPTKFCPRKTPSARRPQGGDPSGSGGPDDDADTKGDDAEGEGHVEDVAAEGLEAEPEFAPFVGPALDVVRSCRTS